MNDVDMPIKHEMTIRPAPRTRRRTLGDRGATMVEFAIVSTVLFSMIFFIVEGAFAVQARNTVNNAVDEAARQAAVSGTDADADWRVLNTLLTRQAHEHVDIEYVVIYNALNGSSGPSDDCLNGTPSDDECNVYTPDFFDTPRDQFGCEGGIGTRWCPKDRVRTDGRIGFIGVYVKSDYKPIIAQILLEFDFRVDANSVQAIETTGERLQQ